MAVLATSATASVVDPEVNVEFDRQVEGLVANGYARRAGMSEQTFRQHLAPLRDRAQSAVSPKAAGRVPFIIVMDRALATPAETIAMVDLKGKPGFTTVDAADLLRFVPIDGLVLPAGLAYLLLDVDTGRELLDVTPDDAMPVLAADGRSPLTLEEGLAVVLHHPGILKQANAFSMLGSRCGDRRVTAVWTSGGRPRLGWCWAGNPHTWLGSASCRSRIPLPL